MSNTTSAPLPGGAAIPPRITDWYSDLSAALRAEIESCTRQRRYQPGQTIYMAGDSDDAMFRIVSGRVRISWIFPTGKEVLMVVYGPGRCIGTVSVLDGLPRHNDAVAETAVVVDMLQAADFHRIARQHPELYKALAVDFARWIRDVHTMFVGGFSLEERLARRLDFLLDCGVAQDAGDGTLRLDLTQEMLASSVAVSRQAIRKLLQDWQDSGLIDHRYKSLVVRDRSRLRRLAGKPAS